MVAIRIRLKASLDKEKREFMDFNTKRLEETQGSGKAVSVVLSAIKAFASLNPIIGAVTSFIFDQLPDVRLKRIQDFLLQLDEDLARACKTIDELELDISTIQPTIELIIQKVLNEPRQQKIDCYRAILINEIAGFSCNEATKECMLNLVESLTILQIHMLSFLFSPEKYLQASGIAKSSIIGGYEQIFRTVFSGVERDLIKAQYKKQYDYSLVSTDVDIFSTMTSAQGLRLIEGRLTPFGEMFVEYITLRGN